MFLTLHVLRNFPLALINRDDTGQHKDTVFGGFPRSRISSQCLKRSIRKRWENELPAEKVSEYVGTRTKFVLNLLQEKLSNLPNNQITEIATAIIKAFFDEQFPAKKTTDTDADVTNYLVFTSDKELNDMLLLYSTEVQAELGKGTTIKEIVKRIKAGKLGKAGDIGKTVDVALFGRMQASASAHSVRAAMQVSHAISVNALKDEFDWFTAVDDFKENRNISGAGHLDSTSCNSSCYYMHGSVSIKKLSENLGNNKMLPDICKELVTAFALATPSGKQNAFAHNTPYGLLIAEIHESQSLNLCNAFEKPVERDHTGTLTENAANRLFEYRNSIAQQLGRYFPAGKMFVSGAAASPEMSPLPLDVLADKVAGTIGELNGL